MSPASDRSVVRTGCDRLLAETRRLAGRRYGLLAHAASIDAEARPLHLALAGSEAGGPAALFSPEHGYYAVEQDMVPSVDQRDPLSGAPIVSLYGDDASSLRPAPEAFEGLDLLVIDLQDVGSRYYTYAATAVWAAEVALAAGLEVWVLDRPNPLGGEVVEGPTVDPGFGSFVGAFPLPVRHGLTLAELVALAAHRGGWDTAGLEVWACEGWRAPMGFAATALPWVAPSPNMPTLTTALVYPGGCLVEGTALSEGRGTTRPFELVGHPAADPGALVETLARRPLEGARFLPTYFKPQFQKHAGEVCGGVQVMVSEATIFTALRAGVEVLFAFRRVLGDTFAWRREAYEFVTDRPAIDLLAGSPALRLALDADDEAALDGWIADWPRQEADFRAERSEVLLYPREGETPTGDR